MELSSDISSYDNKKLDYFRLITEYQYIFEITKCCGYGEWVNVYKKSQINKIFENIQNQFGYRPDKLFVIDNDLNKLEIPDDNSISLRSFIANNYKFFRPIYPYPANIIYRIYIDDGCCHKATHIVSNESNHESNDENKKVLCGDCNCVLHPTPTPTDNASLNININDWDDVNPSFA
jgi:hypothetical protein